MHEQSGAEVEEEVRGGVVSCAVAEGACLEDTVDPIFRFWDLVAAPEFVEHGEGV